MQAKVLATMLIVVLPLLAFANEASHQQLNSPEFNQSEEVFLYNSQNINLLSKRAQELSSAPLSHGGGGVEIVDVSALKPNQDTRSSVNKLANKGGSVSLYIVREGDSLSEIADMFGVSTNTIIWANDLDGHQITPGKTLIILPMSGVRHKVVAGDSVESLAKKYKADEDEIREFNGLDEGTRLLAGDFINIPDGEVEKPVVSVASSSKSSSSSGGSWLASPVRGYVKTQGIHGYNAVDMAAPQGTAVMAAASGTVITAKNDYEWNGGYGNYVVIKHPNGVQTLYSHFGGVLVGVGQEVVQGQVLGYIGMTGKTTGPHLHFEVRGATNPF